MTVDPVVRVEQAGLGPDAQVHLVVSGQMDLNRLRSVWSSSGATVQSVAGAATSHTGAAPPSSYTR